MVSLKRKQLLCILLFLILGIALIKISQTSTIASAESLAIDLYNQRGGQGPNEPSESFAPMETVELTAALTYCEEPVEYKLVGFEVKNPVGEIVADRSNMTNEHGLAKINFTITGECLPEIFGTWTALALASVAEQTVNDTLAFKVTGPYLDVYTQKPEPYSGRGPNQPSDMFAPQEEVILYAEAYYDCEPVEYKFVVFEIRDPSGETLIDRTNATNEYGIATTRFRLASNATFGTYTVLAGVEILGKTASDTLTFNVSWIIEIMKVETVDQYGNPKNNFARGEHMYFNLTAKNNALVPKLITLTVVIYDEQSVPIGQVVLHDWVIPPNPTEIFIVNLQIPKWACVGVSTVFANAYTDLPQLHGVPYCPETSTTFQIVKL